LGLAKNKTAVYIIMDTSISFQNISKTFKVAKRGSGLKAALRSVVKREYTFKKD
jgi:hypothetical protein